VLRLRRAAFGPRFLLRDDAGRLFGLFEGSERLAILRGAARQRHTASTFTWLTQDSSSPPPFLAMKHLAVYAIPTRQAKTPDASDPRATMGIVEPARGTTYAREPA
jgi:hypothetical protein